MINKVITVAQEKDRVIYCSVLESLTIYSISETMKLLITMMKIDMEDEMV